MEQVRLYHVKADDSRWGSDYPYQIDAVHKWMLPGLICPTCGETWATTGLAYPAADFSGVSVMNGYQLDPMVEMTVDRTKPIAYEQFQRLRSLVLPFLPQGSLVLPGTEFGALVGKAVGVLGSFAWPSQWVMLLRSETLERLRAAGVELPQAIPVQLRYAPDSPATLDLLEFDLPPVLRFASSAFSRPPSRCSTCGRLDARLERIVVEASSIPGNQDLLRGYEFPTIILATDRFRKVVESSRMKDITFEDVETV